MTTLALIIPKLYLVPAMSQKLKEKLTVCNEILQALSIHQPYLGVYSSRHRALANEENELPVWEKLSIYLYLMVSEDLFNDAIAILESDGYIAIKGNLLYLTKKGHVFLIKEEGYDHGQHEPLPVISEWVSKDGLLVPKREEDIPVKYKSLMTAKQRTLLTKFLKNNNLVNNPTKFVEFLNGQNEGADLEIYDNKETQTLAAVSILLKELRNRSLIQLTNGNEFGAYFAANVRPFSTYTGKEQIAAFKSEMRKVTNKKWKECPHAQELQKLVETLMVAGITIFVISL